jgi:hypothetical protein
MAEERTLGQLVADASHDVSDLVRHEIALAKAEIKNDVRNAALGGAMFGAAGYLGLLATIMLCIAAGYGLVAAGLTAWGAFLVVAGALLLLAGLLALIGLSRVKKVGPPERTIRTTKEVIAAVKPGTDRGAGAAL